MPAKVLHTENDDYNLTTTQTVLTDTPSADDDLICQIRAALGDGTDDLDGSGGGFEFTLMVGGQTMNGGPETVIFGTATRALVQTPPFNVKAGDQVLFKVKSPNAADTDVDVVATLFEVSEVTDARVAKAGVLNKRVYNQNTGRKTVYDDDDSTELGETEMTSSDNGTIVTEQPV